MSDRPDIVQALRDGIEPHEGITLAEQVMDMAADEIERLRTEVERLTRLNADLDATNERLRAGMAVVHKE